MMRKVVLGDVVKINPAMKVAKGQLVKFISMDKLDPFTKTPNGYEKKKFSSGTKFANGDTLLARITPCLENGKTAFVDFLDDSEVAAGSTEFVILRNIKGLTDPTYIYYLSISPAFRDYAIKSMVGTSGRQRVQNDVLAKMELSLPPLYQQKKIADILSSLDEKIELNRRMNETLEQLGQALFRHYFVDNSEVDSWESGEVSDVVRIYSGFAFKSKDFDIDGRYGLVTIKNVQDGSFIKDCTDHLSEPLPDKTPEHVHLKSGDIILSLTGNVGRVCAVVGRDYLLNQRVAKLVSDESQAYVYFLFRSKTMKDRMVGISKGTAQKNLSPIETGKLKIKIPPTNIMSQFEESAMDLLDMIVSNNEQIQTLISLRDSLLPKLISGEIEV